MEVIFINILRNITSVKNIFPHKFMYDLEGKWFGVADYHVGSFFVKTVELNSHLKYQKKVLKFG